MMQEELHLVNAWPDICILMQVNSARSRCLINPSSDTLVEEGDQLIMMRPTCIASHAYKPLKKPVTVDKGKLTPAQSTVSCKESSACQTCFLRCPSDV